MMTEPTYYVTTDRMGHIDAYDLALYRQIRAQQPVSFKDLAFWWDRWRQQGQFRSMDYTLQRLTQQGLVRQIDRATATLYLLRD